MRRREFMELAAATLTAGVAVACGPAARGRPLSSRLVLGSLALTLGAAAGCSSNTPAPLPRATQPTKQSSQPTPSRERPT